MCADRWVVVVVGAETEASAVETAADGAGTGAAATAAELTKGRRRLDLYTLRWISA